MLLEVTVKHTLIIYGKLKGHGKLRKNTLLYDGPISESAATNIRKWWVEAQKKEKA
jgi:hypothetical protein